jgi:hypothetical protein
MDTKQTGIPPRTGKCQIIKCHCGNVFAACTEPECFTDKDWQKDVRSYVKGGCTVETVSTAELKEMFGVCNCEHDKTGKKKATIEPKSENQLELF